VSPDAENRIRLKVQQEATPISLQDQVDLKAQIKVDVETHLTGLGMGGVIALTLGALGLVAGSVLFLSVYPDQWYGDPDDMTHYTYVRTVELLWGFGIMLLLLGTAMFFYGRTVLGSGGLQQLESIESLGRE
jgi:hypothetical protein